MSTDAHRAVSRPAGAGALTRPGDEGMPRARRLALAEMAVGVPAAAWGVRRRSVGWTVVGAVLMAHGALELSYETVLPRD
ncbi:hypothetical protein [Streptomyces shenzhenensis]|uniref:hypothetical protein n=1 Tax=Streptomyces shenzhenensis TaxID=943815 RepID=UPI001F234DC3|nr:hypothetical protein [Streptomyces shenzhenensis]